jgi:RNA-directed DNA polymerase
VQPAKKNIKNIKAKISEVTSDKNVAGKDLIGVLNPILMGWASYFHKVVRKKVFQKIGSHAWYCTYQWRKKKHPTLSGKALFPMYYKKLGDAKWNFSVTIQGKTYFLYNIRKTPIV